jgi:hypothetical protein
MFARFIYTFVHYFFFLATLLKVFAKLYRLDPGLQVGPPNLEPVQTPSVPLRLIEAATSPIQFFFYFTTFFHYCST